MRRSWERESVVVRGGCDLLYDYVRDSNVMEREY